MSEYFEQFDAEAVGLAFEANAAHTVWQERLNYLEAARLLSTRTVAGLAVTPEAIDILAREANAAESSFHDANAAVSFPARENQEAEYRQGDTGEKKTFLLDGVMIEGGTEFMVSNLSARRFAKSIGYSGQQTGHFGDLFLSIVREADNTFADVSRSADRAVRRTGVISAYLGEYKTAGAYGHQPVWGIEPSAFVAFIETLKTDQGMRERVGGITDFSFGILTRYAEELKGLGKEASYGQPRVVGGEVLQLMQHSMELSINRSLGPEDQVVQEYLDRGLEDVWADLVEDPRGFRDSRTVRDMLIVGTGVIPKGRKVYLQRLERIAESVPSDEVTLKSQPTMEDIVRLSGGRLDKVTAEVIDARHGKLTIADLLTFDREQLEETYNPASLYDYGADVYSSQADKPLAVARNARTFARDFLAVQQRLASQG